MNIVYHKGLTSKDWSKKDIFYQMANIGSEVFRMIKWKTKNKKNSQIAFERALELLDLTLADKGNKTSLKEIARVREALVDYNLDNEYKTTDEFWQKYFYGFNYAARLN
ncbi:MAG: hypothetical protein HW405_143 [Candidatus Berkelbacteria bacterium]|nr:hypothetical protein [Candidatus Berkelbacteria bacterium]